MRKRIAICVMVLAIMLCMGCNAKNVKNQDITSEHKTTEDTVLKEQNEEVPNTEESTSDETNRIIEESIIMGDSYDDMYSTIFNNYQKAIEECWDKESLHKANISEKLMRFYADGKSVEQIGYKFLDLNGDDFCELIIGVMNQHPTMQNSILDIYTIEKNQLIHVISCQNAQSCYICFDEAGSYQIALIESKYIEKKGWHYWNMEESHLSVVQGIIYDKTNHINGPWFMTYDSDWNSNNDEPIEKKLAKDIIESYKNTYLQIPYDVFE